jgi:hypothetical protein
MKVFGTHLAPSQWLFPVKEKELEGETSCLALGEVRFTNPHVRAVMSSIDLIIEACVDDENEDDSPTNMQVAMKYYWEGVGMLRLKSEYSEHDTREKKKAYEMMDDKTWTSGWNTYSKEELADFKQHFYRLWIMLYDRDGCTKYIHNWGTGHIYYFMDKYGFLSQFSQQSHEAANAIMMSFFQAYPVGWIFREVRCKIKTQTPGTIVPTLNNVADWTWTACF